jgi:hypothetical protein
MKTRKRDEKREKHTHRVREAHTNKSRDRTAVKSKYTKERERRKINIEKKENHREEREIQREGDIQTEGQTDDKSRNCNCCQKRVLNYQTNSKDKIIKTKRAKTGRTGQTNKQTNRKKR